MGKRVTPQVGSQRPGGRPALLRGGRRVQVYLDADAVAAATRLGAGNVSRGIRAALARRQPSPIDSNLKS